MSGIDRISALPDDVLVHILSFLPTKISVSTCVLSKRWGFLWAHVPNLDFDTYDYDAAMSFSDTVNGIIAKHKGLNIHTFRLHNSRDYGFTYSELERWTAFAIERNVKKLDLNILSYLPVLPGSLFTCKTLVDLSLKSCKYITITSDVNLPSLKKLHLQMVRYESNESLPRLLSGCPVLEELIINTVNYIGFWCCISSPTLSRLVLESEFFNVFGAEAFRVKIDTPALRYLKLRDRVASQNVLVGRLPYLNEADICLVNNKVDILQFRHVMEFVGKLCNVKTLKLSIGWMEVSDSIFFNSSTIKFPNLRDLWLNAADWRFITFFLEIADNLRFLEISMDNKNPNYWMEPKQVPTCLLSHLGMVRIHYFRCTQPAFSMVRYILRNAKVLKKIEMCFRSYGIDLKERSEARRIISLFERGSESCQLAFPTRSSHLLCRR